MSKTLNTDDFFDKAAKLLDEVYGLAQDALDATFVKADHFLDEWRENAEAFVNRHVTGEPVKVKPDLAVMREDLKKYRAENGAHPDTLSVWDRANEATVVAYWESMPDEFKSWVVRDSNSPL